MTESVLSFLGLLLPFLGTLVGAALVLFLRRGMCGAPQKALLGFASGVMIAASVWSLLIPAINMSEEVGKLPAWIPPALGFLFGMGFLLLLDTVIPHLHPDRVTPEGRSASIGKSAMLIFAVTLHNVPEGMAVGAVYAALISGSDSVSAAGALALSLGIALQNLPEGAVVSMPLVGEGMSRRRAFFLGALSGVVEPLGALLMLWMTAHMTAVLPYLLAFAAGAMIYVVVEELVPETQAGEHSDVGTVGVALGFALMMVLDVALG